MLPTSMPSPAHAPRPAAITSKCFSVFTSVCSSLLAGWIGLVVVVAPASADQPPSPLDAFTDTVDVRVVNLEAVVTHRRGPDRGHHVEGLGPADFVLEVDGVEVPIEYFTEIRDGVAVDASSAAGSDAVALALPALPRGEPVPTRYLVFVDNYYSIAARRDAVLRRLADQLDEMRPQDHMAVVAYDGSSVRMMSSWSRDRETLRRVLREVSELPAFGLQSRSDLERMQTLADYGSLQGVTARSVTTASSSFSSIGFRGARRESLLDRRSTSGAPGPTSWSEPASRVSRVALAAASALRGFARPDGRKVMLLLSGGLPALGDASAAADLLHVRRPLAPLVDTANRLGYTLYPVDLGASSDAELPSAADATLDESLYRRSLQRQADYFSEDALLFLARATGGEAYLDSSRFIALRRAVDDTRSYYWLGFTPAWREDDGSHRVELKVRRPGVSVRSRDGFTDLSQRSLVSLRVESAQLFDAPLSSDVRLRVAAGPPRPGGVGKMVVPLRIELPLDRLTLFPAGEGEGYRGRAEVRVIATDDGGNVSPVPVVDVDLASAGEPKAGAVQTFEISLQLRRRPHRLLVAVHDPATGALYGERLEISP